MKTFVVEKDNNMYMLQGPNFIVDNIYEYKERFYAWLEEIYSRTNPAVEKYIYTIEDFINYLNTYVIKNNVEKVKTIKPLSMPLIYF